MLSKKKPQDKVDPEYLVGLDTAAAQPAPAGVKPFIKKHWKPITAAICAAAVAAAVLVPKNSAKPAAASAQYVETRPEKRNIVNSYSADGTITAADTYTVKPMVKGTVLTADFEVDELDILDIQVGQKAEITADAISDRTFEGVVTSISSAGTTSGGTTTYPVTIRIDDTGSLMPGMNATAALDIPPCQRYVIVKATAGFAVFRLILKSLLFYSCLDFTQNLGKTHFCLTFGVHFSIRSLFFGIFFNVFAIGIYSFDSCFLSTTWIS